MPIKNYRTKLTVEQHVNKIMNVLMLKGARQITVQYEQNSASGLAFVFPVSGLPIPFRLPCNVAGVKRALSHLKKYGNLDKNAPRVAWAILSDWVQAQLAIVEAGQVSMEQVFLPYAIINEADNLTVFDKFIAQVGEQKALKK